MTNLFVRSSERAIALLLVMHTLQLSLSVEASIWDAGAIAVMIVAIILWYWLYLKQARKPAGSRISFISRALCVEYALKGTFFLETSVKVSA